ncbi:MAG: hypothetical protein KDK70_42420 [Myxococcales bacterium]|nr:hypothetical protein [Myxococcales bacterium]
MEILGPGRPIDPSRVDAQLRRWQAEARELTAMLCRGGDRVAIASGLRVGTLEPALVLRSLTTMLSIPWPTPAECFADEGTPGDELLTVQIWLPEGECLIVACAGSGSALAPWSG